MTDMEKMIRAFIQCGCPVEKNGALAFTAAGRKYWFTEGKRTLKRVKDYITCEEYTLESEDEVS